MSYTSNNTSDNTTINPFLAAELDAHRVEAVLQYLVERSGAQTVQRQLDELCGRQAIEVRE